MKDFVPSMGSKIQTNSASARSAGKLLADQAMIRIGELHHVAQRRLRLAVGDGDRAGIGLGDDLDGVRKYRRTTLPLASASRSASARNSAGQFIVAFRAAGRGESDCWRSQAMSRRDPRGLGRPAKVIFVPGTSVFGWARKASSSS